MHHLGEDVFTIIQEGLATTLGLEPVGTVKARKLPLGGCKSYQYLLWVHFLDQGYLVKLGVIEAPRLLHPDNRVKCLIGRDILQFVKLLYNGPDNTFSLSF
jgi:hypothetical protein